MSRAHMMLVDCVRALASPQGWDCWRLQSCRCWSRDFLGSHGEYHGGADISRQPVERSERASGCCQGYTPQRRTKSLDKTEHNKELGEAANNET